VPTSSRSNSSGYAYTIEGRLVTLRPPPKPPLDGARDIFTVMLHDESIPNGALLLVDARESDVDLAPGLVRNRVELVWSLLSGKFAPFLAVVPASSATGLTAHRFQMDAAVFAGIRVGIFQSIEDARQWLELH
jgi:hypothetical protein